MLNDVRRIVMKIVTSQLSMDASTGHREVTKKTVYGSSAINNSTAVGDDSFRLPYLTRFGGKEKTMFLSTGFTADSIVKSDGDVQVHKVENQQEVVESVVSRLFEQKAKARENISGSSFLHPYQEHRSNGKRYYQVGKQPFEMAFHVGHTSVEQDFMSFRTEGNITTEDGRNIAFSMGLDMERTTVRYQSVDFSSMVRFTDPIVLNFESEQEVLSSSFDFLFDLDCDGETELLPGLSSGKGFLALDINGDKTINNGQELFGPVTGSGLSELSWYDSDNNNWIDENDAVFHELLVWFNVGGKEERLVSLIDAGVGAISLQHLDTEFVLKGQEGQVLGQVAASSVFLTEDGQVRSLQEIDYANPVDTNTDVGVVSAGEQSLFAEVRESLRQHRERMVQALRKKREEEEHGPGLEARFWQWQEEKMRIG